MYSGMMNNNRTKALFFDIDGTLLSEKTRRVPDSAKEALKQAREKGHLVLINTGRVYPHLTQIVPRWMQMASSAAVVLM